MAKKKYLFDKPAARNYIGDEQNGVFYDYRGHRISYYKIDDDYVFSLYDNADNVLESAAKVDLPTLNSVIETGAYFYKNIDARKFDKGGLIEDELATNEPILGPKPKPSNNKIAKAVLLSIISDGVIKLKDGQKPYHKEDLLNEFRDMAADSKDFDRFLVKVRNKKDVSPEVSKQFFNIYNKSGNLTPDQAASKLYMQVDYDIREYNKAPELTNPEKEYYKKNKKDILDILGFKSLGAMDILVDHNKIIRDAIEKHKKTNTYKEAVQNLKKVGHKKPSEAMIEKEIKLLEFKKANILNDAEAEYFKANKNKILEIIRR